MAITAYTLLTPGNNSSATGLGVVSLDGATLRVDVTAFGLTANAVHALHLHGLNDDRPGRSAVAADDADRDGYLETPEVEVAYGPVLAALTASGEAQAGLEVSSDFPTANAIGLVRFTRSYRLDAGEADDASILARLGARLEGRVLDLHGLNLPAGAGAGTPNEVEGNGGYEPALPAASGVLQLFDLTGPGAVNRLYDAAFNRSADVPGLVYHVTTLENGATREAVAAGFLLSAEGQGNLGGLDDSGFVSQLYRNALNREVEEAGLNFWLDVLDRGASRGDVLLGISESGEHQAILPDTVLLDRANLFLDF